jgi:hypothetical protein
MVLDLIYTKDEIIISKKQQDWRTWQDQFKEYKPSLSFQNVDELTGFLQTEYDLRQMACEIIANGLYENDSNFLLLELPVDDTNLPSLKNIIL